MAQRCGGNLRSGEPAEYAFVAVKSKELQSVLILHTACALVVSNRTEQVETIGTPRELGDEFRSISRLPRGRCDDLWSQTPSLIGIIQPIALWWSDEPTLRRPNRTRWRHAAATRWFVGMPRLMAAMPPKLTTLVAMR
jgi:hypothetical protein